MKWKSILTKGCGRQVCTYLSSQLESLCVRQRAESLGSCLQFPVQMWWLAHNPCAISSVLFLNPKGFWGGALKKIKLVPLLLAEVSTSSASLICAWCFFFFFLKYHEKKCLSQSFGWKRQHSSVCTKQATVTTIALQPVWNTHFRQGWWCMSVTQESEIEGLWLVASLSLTKRASLKIAKTTKCLFMTVAHIFMSFSFPRKLSMHTFHEGFFLWNSTVWDSL